MLFFFSVRSCLCLVFVFHRPALVYRYLRCASLTSCRSLSFAGFLASSMSQCRFMFVYMLMLSFCVFLPFLSDSLWASISNSILSMFLNIFFLFFFSAVTTIFAVVASDIFVAVLMPIIITNNFNDSFSPEGPTLYKLRLFSGSLRFSPCVRWYSTLLYFDLLQALKCIFTASIQVLFYSVKITLIVCLFVCMFVFCWYDSYHWRKSDVCYVIFFTVEKRNKLESESEYKWKYRYFI